MIKADTLAGAFTVFTEDESLIRWQWHYFLKTNWFGEKRACQGIMAALWMDADRRLSQTWQRVRYSFVHTAVVSGRASYCSMRPFLCSYLCVAYGLLAGCSYLPHNNLTYAFCLMEHFSVQRSAEQLPKQSVSGFPARCVGVSFIYITPIGSGTTCRTTGA